MTIEDAVSATAAPPARPGPYLDSGLLPGDFSLYEQLLSEPERETVARLREFLRAEVEPSVAFAENRSPVWSGR
jgi:hypothetical protein